MSLPIVSNLVIKKKLNLELEKEHFQAAIIGGVLQFPWTIWESFFTKEFWMHMLLMRIFTLVLPIFLYYTYKKFRISSALCLHILVMSISFESFYAISNMDIDGFQIYTFGIITFFLGTGMLVTWDFSYSVFYLVTTLLLSALLFYVNSPLTLIEILSYGGFAFYTTGFFSVALIYMRYASRFKNLKVRMELANSIDELNEITYENKILSEELQLIDKSALIAEMTSSVAHELNTPISVIKNSSAILVESFHEVLKLPNQGVNWTHLNYILLKLSERPMFTSYFQKIKEAERIESYLHTLRIDIPEDLIHLLASSGISRDDKEILDLIFENADNTVLIQMIYQLRVIQVMNGNIASSVSQTATIIQEMRSIQLQTTDTEMTMTNLKLSFEKAISIFEFQTKSSMTINTEIDDLLEIKTSKFKLIQLWVKLFEFITLSNDVAHSENRLFITAKSEETNISVTFQHNEGQGFNYDVLNNVNSIFRQHSSNKIDTFNLNILRTFIADFNFDIKITDTSMLIVMPVNLAHAS